ncbi:hypothetical protein MJ904_13795 [Massilia sp. MB5]|uniref:hypothetical protein n=1 Tax=unclassified Massilia TaxID=2609279 RepID=UPI00067E527F|nr:MULTISPECIES: hypothetical protein [unclassified Massilia]AKU22113.1 hypothetical protein ACZ75_12205 [Massilia sp. NR 4-1]UMR33137.1 hypothetical protein MJ904_13795 [Massilia sp. MB5]
MAKTIHRNFKEIADAEQARAALLNAGWRAAAVQMNRHEARPADTSTSAVRNLFDSLTPDAADDTDQPLSSPAALLSVDVDDEVHREQADAIMRHYGASEA